jgi:putative transposase
LARPRDATLSSGQRGRRAGSRRCCQRAGASGECLIHRVRNVLAKVPARAQDEVKNAYWALFDTDDLIAGGLQPGQRLVDVVQARIDRFAEQYGKLYPAAVRCLLTDREQLTSYLRFPTEHHRRIRHSNFIERTFGETRRRVKVIGRLPGETSCLSLVWAVLDRASRGWRGLTMTPQGLRLLQDLRRQLLDPPTPIRPPIHDAPNDHKTVGAVA